MSIGSVFVNKRTQAVRLPANTRFPDTIKKVSVRVVGQDRILSSIHKSWDSFFLTSDRESDDFISRLEVLAYDEKEFNRVDGLRIENWTSL